MQQNYKKIFYVGLKLISDLFSVNLPLVLAALFIYDFTLKEYFKSFNELIILSSVLIAAIMSIFKLYEVEIPERKDLFSRTAIALLIFFSVSYFNLVISSYNYSWQLLLFVLSSKSIIIPFLDSRISLTIPIKVESSLDSLRCLAFITPPSLDLRIFEILS